MSRLILAGLLAFAFLGNVFSQEKPDAALDERVRDLATELRCLVCQNQTLADSNADLAVDLRRTIREQLAAGATDRQVIDFMTARYGDFVLYRPPLKATTVLLWIGPFLLLVGGLVILVRRLTAKRPEEKPISEEERARAAELLGPGRE